MTITRILVAFYPTTFACYYSTFEFVQIATDYIETIFTWRKLLFNVVHNLGNIYDCTIDLIDVFRFSSPDEREYWQRIGRNSGTIVYDLAYKPGDFDPYEG